MAPQDPPRDDDEPKTDTPEDAVTPEIEDDGNAPRNASTDSADAVDAEIVDEVEASTFDGKEQPEERAEDEGMALSDETPEDTPIPEEMEDAANENDSGGGSLAAPFAIIVGALVVIAALVIFLNRNDENTLTASVDNTSVQTAEADNSQPVIPDPSMDGSDNNGGGGGTSEIAENTESLRTSVSSEHTGSGGGTEQINEPSEGSGETELRVADDQETESTASETVAAMVSGPDDDLAEEDNATRRSALIARAAERNRARRAGLPEANVASAADEPATEDTTDESTASVEEPAEEEMPEGTDHSGTSVSAEIIAAAVAPNEVESTENASNTDAQDEPEGNQSTEDRDTRVTELESTVAGLVADLKATRDSQVTGDSSETQVAQMSPAPAPDLEELKSDVKADVLAETEQVIDQKLQETEREVQALRSELTEQQRLADERLTALTQKIDTIETSELTVARQSTLLLALSDLEDSIESGEPFLRELDNVERISPTSRSLGTLRAHAATGLLTDKELAGSYALAARRALSSAKREDADGPLARLGANLSGLFSVRKVGEVEGDTPSAIIARAETRLEGGDIEGAVEQLNELTGPARDAFAEWVEAAEAKAEAERQIEALERAVTARAG